MTTKAQIDEFISHKTLGVVGVSRDTKKFGYAIFDELRKKGYKVYPINPNATELYGEKSYPSITMLPKDAEGVVIVVPPAKAEGLVKEAHAKGINQVWLQQGAESKAALAYCSQNKMNAISGECILMHLEPVGSFHGFHRFFRKLFGGMPK
jgi:uncharacterized protein